MSQKPGSRNRKCKVGLLANQFSFPHSIVLLVLRGLVRDAARGTSQKFCTRSLSSGAESARSAESAEAYPLAVVREGTGTLTRAKGAEVVVCSLPHGVARCCERACNTGEGDHACWF